MCACQQIKQLPARSGLTTEYTEHTEGSRGGLGSVCSVYSVVNHSLGYWHPGLATGVIFALMPDTMSQDQFMREAIKLAETGMQDGQGGPFGCVVVRHGQVVGRGNNRV